MKKAYQSHTIIFLQLIIINNICRLKLIYWLYAILDPSKSDGNNLGKTKDGENDDDSKINLDILFDTQHPGNKKIEYSCNYQ